MLKGRVAIVDPSPAGPTGNLVSEFGRAGYECVYVQSTPVRPKMYEAVVPTGFVDEIVHDGDLDRTLALLSRHEPVAVVPDSEFGVPFADLLSERTGLPTNGTGLSAARRDKYRMIETIRAAGLRGARQLLVTDAEELASWHRELGGRIVIKPLSSAGSQGVHYCDTPERAVEAYRSLIGTEDIFSVRNDAVVAQEYLVGTEYSVNTVSRDGRHHLCDIWKATQITANGVLDLCDGLVLLPHEGERVETVVAYCEQVLDAMGIRHGPAHLDVKLTPSGPCLIEVGARMGGGWTDHYARMGTGESQLNWTVDAYTAPERFLARHQERYRIREFIAGAPLISPVEGTLRAYRGLEELKRLESYHGLRTFVQPGGRIARTVDDLTYPLLVELRHEVQDVVLRDLATVRWLDGERFYDVERA